MVVAVFFFDAAVKVINSFKFSGPSEFSPVVIPGPSLPVSVLMSGETATVRPSPVISRSVASAAGWLLVVSR